MIHRRSLVVVACAASLAAGAPACAALDSWDEFSRPSAGHADDAGSDARVDAPPPEASSGDAGRSIDFVQVNAVAVDNMSPKSIDVPFNGPQATGDLNVVVVGWYDTGVSVDSVVDSSGNRYQPAGPPTSVNGPDPIVQAIYYAPHVAAALAGANVVTVTWNSPACSPDVRVAEFRGVGTLDVTAGSSGLDGPVSLTAATPTKVTPELIVAGGTSTSGFSTADPPYTLAIISSESSIVEYRVVNAPGVYGAAPPLLNGKSWVMQLATFQ
jgi:hypothetical protein